MDAVKFLKEREWLGLVDSKLYGKELMMTNKTFEEQVLFVEQWAKAHPQKTRTQDLFEKYPNAPKDDDGIPRVCAAALGYRDFCDVGKENINCKNCWNQPLE